VTRNPRELFLLPTALIISLITIVIPNLNQNYGIDQTATFFLIALDLDNRRKPSVQIQSAHLLLTSG